MRSGLRISLLAVVVSLSTTGSTGVTIESTISSLPAKVIQQPVELPEPPPPPPPTVSIVWVGDLTFGNKGSFPKGGVKTILGKVADYLSSDLTIGNLETVIGDMYTTKCGSKKDNPNCYAFIVPPIVAQQMADIGFSAVNVANNHTLDAGNAGKVATDKALKEAGIAIAGRPDKTAYVTRNGLKIAILGFAPYSYCGNLLDISKAKARVAKAKAKADLVIVTMHLGAEGESAQHVRPGTEYGFGENRGNALDFTHGVIDAGADLVLGSGPHVLRGMQWYKGKLIAFSLGNFSGYHTLGNSGKTGISGILHVTLDAEGRFVVGSVTPIIIKGSGTPEYDKEGRAITNMNKLSKADFKDKHPALMDKEGVIKPPDQ